MRHLMSLCVLAVGLVGPVIASPMFDFGKQACLQVLDGQVEGLNGALYRRNIAEDGLTPDGFCSCTGHYFENNVPYQQNLMMSAKNEQEESKVMREILKTNMAPCFVSTGG